MLYADFDSLTKPTDEPKRDNTLAYQEHVPCGYAFKIVCTDEKHTH